MEKGKGELVVPEELVTPHFMDGGLVYYYPGKRSMKLPDGLLAGTLVEAEWPGQNDDDHAYFMVREPPEGKTGVYIETLRPEEVRRMKELQASGQGPSNTYEVKIVEEAKKPV